LFFYDIIFISSYTTAFITSSGGVEMIATL
jgi:hypothetical protein